MPKHFLICYFFLLVSSKEPDIVRNREEKWDYVIGREC